MAKVSRSFVDETLWPEHEQLSAELRKHLEAVTQRVIEEVLESDGTDAKELAEGSY